MSHLFPVPNHPSAQTRFETIYPYYYFTIDNVPSFWSLLNDLLSVSLFDSQFLGSLCGSDRIQELIIITDRFLKHFGALESYSLIKMLCFGLLFVCSFITQTNRSTLNIVPWVQKVNQKKNEMRFNEPNHLIIRQLMLLGIRPIISLSTPENAMKFVIWWLRKMENGRRKT